MSTEAKEVLGQQAVANTQRTVTVVTTRGEKRKIPFNGTEWSQLKSLLESGGSDIEGQSFSGYSLSNMKCVESINRSTLEHPKAVIPDGNFNLFLMPYKSKSGGPARDKIKELFAQNRDAAKAHFGNYTQIKEEVLAELLKTYQGGVTVASSPSLKDKVKTEADVLAAVKTKKEGNLLSKVNTAIQLLFEVREELGGDATPKLQAETPIPVETKPQKTQAEIDTENKVEQDRKDAEKKRKQKVEEDKKLEAEMDDLMGGFNDVIR